MSENRWISDLHWRRESRQSRSEKTQAALLDATEALIVEKGTDETSMAEIAKRAGCSVGTVYHHFKNKQALFFALFHRMTETYAELTLQASDPLRWEGAGVMDLVKGYIDFMLQLSNEAAASKAAAALVVADHPELRVHIAELQSDGRKAMADLILARKEEIRRPNPQQATAFFIDQLGAMLHARIDPTQRKAAIAAASDAQFTQEVLHLAEAYLDLDPCRR
ncbi:MAG: TetR/AcrR family transcriptional regulator [Alphaproteobacteria bacterium]|nr:TetR/AcrR family transcriptional regulator [Alphaproteobacteria bacterium]